MYAQPMEAGGFLDWVLNFAAIRQTRWSWSLWKMFLLAIRTLCSTDDDRESVTNHPERAPASLA